MIKTVINIPVQVDEPSGLRKLIHGSHASVQLVVEQFVSDRAAAHNSVKGVTSPGACWAGGCQGRAEQQPHTARRLDNPLLGLVTTRRRTQPMITEGNYFHKGTDRRCFDPAVVPATAYLAPA